MTKPRPVLLTGATGRLGVELVKLLPAHNLAPVLTPTRQQLDVTLPGQVMSFVHLHKPRLIIHAAAFTDVVAAESNKELAWTTNVQGTQHVAAAAKAVAAKLLHISTDYVFSGLEPAEARHSTNPVAVPSVAPGAADRVAADPAAVDRVTAEGDTASAPTLSLADQVHGATNGRYMEDDPLGPPINYYALTKIAAEEAARAAAGSLVVRTSFRAREWPYERAFTDVFTSQDYVDVIAPLLAEVAGHYDADHVPYGTLHVGTERKSVFELARRRAPGVVAASRHSAAVRLPADVSLNLSRWLAMRNEWARGS